MSLSPTALPRRQSWLTKLAALTGTLSQKAAQVEQDLTDEIAKEGVVAIRDHLHLCGAIPEIYATGSSDEKLYSKYTDVVVAVTLRAIGLTSRVIITRSNSADVEAEAKSPAFDLVADAKAFRLSRTALNPKDLKIEAMAGWKGQRAHALVVCPVYRLPAGNSAIYEKALARGVTVFTYSHLSGLVVLADQASKLSACDALLAAVATSASLSPTLSADAYWKALNGALISKHSKMKVLLQQEQQANLDGLRALKAEELAPLNADRTSIMSMNLSTAQKSLIKDRRIDSRLTSISSVTDRGLLAIT